MYPHRQRDRRTDGREANEGLTAAPDDRLSVRAGRYPPTPRQLNKHAEKITGGIAISEWRAGVPSTIDL